MNHVNATLTAGPVNFDHPFFPLRALGYGLLSALSFPLGALLALRCAVPQRTVGKLLAFGSGALIHAVSVSLYGSNLARLKTSMDPRCPGHPELALWSHVTNGVIM